MIKINILEKKVLKFLLSGSAYSDTAIMKNFGISREELIKIYDILYLEGFLENYDDFLKNNPEFKNCNKSCCSCDCNSHDSQNIKVLTKKALNLEKELKHL